MKNIDINWTKWGVSMSRHNRPSPYMFPAFEKQVADVVSSFALLLLFTYNGTDKHFSHSNFREGTSTPNTTTNATPWTEPTAMPSLDQQQTPAPADHH
jgi:hypothetical protein